MNDDELWAAIDAQRLRTADLLGELTPREWGRPSLCEGWSVRDVAAHLTLQQMTLGSALRGTLRHPGSLNHIIRATAQDRAALAPEEIVAEIRAMVGSRRHNVGVTPYETLIDIVVHGQDIAVPSGRALEVPPTVAATAASRVWDVPELVEVEGLPGSAPRRAPPGRDRHRLDGRWGAGGPGTGAGPPAADDRPSRGAAAA